MTNRVRPPWTFQHRDSTRQQPDLTTNTMPTTPPTAWQPRTRPTPPTSGRRLNQSRPVARSPAPAATNQSAPPRQNRPATTANNTHRQTPGPTHREHSRLYYRLHTIPHTQLHDTIIRPHTVNKLVGRCLRWLTNASFPSLLLRHSPDPTLPPSHT